MKYTSNLNLKKPDGTDIVNIDDLNENMDILDTEMAKKADIVEGKGLSTEDFTTAEKNKLAGIEAGAQKNVAPTWNNVTGKPSTFPPGAHSHGAADITEAANKRFMTDAERTKLAGIAAGAQVNPGTATTSAAGLMSAADKVKLNGIATGAQVNRPVATEAQAKAGTDNTTDMTPLRVAQAIAASESIAKIATGIYTGDGTTDRPIATGFEPKMVTIAKIAEDISKVPRMAILLEGAIMHAVNDNSVWFQMDNFITSTGYIAPHRTGSYAYNSSNVTYRWVAIS